MGQGEGDSASTDGVPDASPGVLDASVGAPDAALSEADTTTVPTTLAARYADYFAVGAAVDSNSYLTHEPLLVEHFNSITTEDEMKFDALQPTEGNFTFDTNHEPKKAFDAVVDF
jgi:GH35 family endo-1,4-beta-xylanase